MSPGLLVLTVLSSALAAPFVNANVATTSVAFEDVPDASSDYDLNDAVLRYNKRCRVDLASGFDLVAEEIQLAPISAGAVLQSALVLRFDVAPASVEIAVDGAAPTTLCAGDCTDAVTIHDPVPAGFEGMPTGFVNTVAGEPVVRGLPTTVRVAYAPGNELGALSCPAGRFELRRPGVTVGQDTRLPDQRPSAATFPGDWRVPTERTPLDDAYERFLSWLGAALGGCEPGACPDEDWYVDAVPGLVIDRGPLDLAVTAPLPDPASCADGAQNQDETGIDCGGDLCPACANACGCDDGNPCNGVETCDTGGACVPGVPVLDQSAPVAVVGQVDSMGNVYSDPYQMSVDLQDDGASDTWGVFEFDLAALNLGDARGVEHAALSFYSGWPGELAEGQSLVFRLAEGDGQVTLGDPADGAEVGRLDGPLWMDWPTSVDLTAGVAAAADAGWDWLSIRVSLESQSSAWFSIEAGGPWNPDMAPSLALNAGLGDTPDDGVACTIDTCDPATRTPVFTASDDACQNGTLCDGYETCDPTLDCQAGTPVDLFVLPAEVDGTIWANGTYDATGTTMLLEDTEKGRVSTSGVVKWDLGALGLTSPHQIADARFSFVVAQATTVPAGEEGFVVWQFAPSALPISSADNGGGMDVRRWDGPATFAAGTRLEALVTDSVRAVFEEDRDLYGLKLSIRSGPRPFQTTVHASEGGAETEPVLVINGSCFP